MPAKFGMIAALQGDLDTSDGVGKVFFRQDSTPEALRRSAEHINRAFPEDDEVSPTHTTVITWSNVASREPPARGDTRALAIKKKVSIPFCYEVICSRTLVKGLVCNIWVDSLFLNYRHVFKEARNGPSRVPQSLFHN